ncbi:hypothetical protein N431DRAFT_471417 [Stipitochalara longipes BDJ]|nr:hypothetical protein N431DRAFT_471417 [Stipitochalara longipes BDJ]
MKELILANQLDGGVFLDKAKALGHLYNLYFWDRTWIWQELIVAWSIQFLWDVRSMDLEPFFIAGHILLDLEDDEWTFQPLRGIDLILRPPGKPRSLACMVLILRQCAEWRRYNAFDFKNLLNYSRWAQSGDPRDKLYAICGLVPQAYRLAPNYRDAIASVYCSTVWSIISTERSFNILAYCEAPTAQGSIFFLTWCPDWSVKSRSRRSGLLTRDFPTYSGRFNACKTLAGSYKMEALKDEEGKVSAFVLYANGLLSTVNKKRPITEELKAELDRTATVDNRGYLGTRESRGPFGDSRYRILKIDAIEGNRRFFVTKKGFMGMAPPHVSPGDIICVLPGTRVPLLLRKVERSYIVVGEVYVSDGYMKGRAFDEMERGERSLEEFEIY